MDDSQMISAKESFRFLQRHSQRIGLALFAAYCLFIVYYTLLCRTAGAEHKADLRLMWAYREMLILYPGWKEDVGYNLKNILFFVPFGFWFPKNIIRPSFFKKRQWLTILTSGMLFSVIIEVTQYITCRGLCELDDVLCNGFGALTGFWLCLASGKMLAAIIKSKKFRS